MNKQEIIDLVNAKIAEGNAKFNLNLSVPEIRWETKGRALGCAAVSGKYVGFNMKAAELMGQDFANTVIHEIAHLFTFKRYPNAKQGHGPEFRRVCAVLGCSGAAKAEVSQEVLNLFRKNKVTRVEWKCSCQTHLVSKKLNTIMLQERQVGRYRVCARCNHRVAPVVESVETVPTFKF